MSDERFAFGDRVRHATRPEWGVGSVVKAEEQSIDGQRAQRLSIRFPGVGVKTLSTAHARLERVTDAATGASAPAEPHPLRGWDEIGEDEWLAPVAQREIEKAMIRLPEAAGDPFRSLRQRIEFTIGLYRFDRTGRGLIDWAVAQTGLDDPMTRFNRHELERFFDRWAFERDAHFGRLLQEANEAAVAVDDLLAAASPVVRKAARRGLAAR